MGQIGISVQFIEFKKNFHLYVLAPVMLVCELRPSVLKPDFCPVKAIRITISN